MELKGWDKLYQELAEKINTNIPAINWVDLWHNQVGFLVEEHPFSAPALFFAFRILSVEDQGEKVQKVTLQIDMYYFYETFLDTFSGAYNEGDALDYLDTLTEVHKLFHGTSGKNYSEMRRTGLSAVDTGSSGNLYLQSFSCAALDTSALIDFNTIVPGEIEFSEGKEDTTAPEPFFKVNLTGN